MAEKGILILDQADGESIACRDANALDGDDNPRIIQRLCKSVAQLPMPLGTPTRTNVVADDTYDLESLPADLTDNLITMGDKSRIAVYSLFGSVNGSAYITLLLFDNEASPTVIGKLAHLYIGNNCYGNHYTKAGATKSLGRVTIADFENTQGAQRVGIHVDDLTNPGTGFNIWAFPI